VSDVVAGWAAGLLVLLALPFAEPLVDAVDRWIVALYRGPAATRPQSAPPPQG
jgi:undecaprenyl-diphosphatase